MELNKNITCALAAIAAGIVLYASSLYSYLLFHSIAELFSIVIAAGIFVIAWNTRAFQQNAYLLYIGIAFLFVAFIDLLHTLSYKGMGVFGVGGANLSTQLWIAARYIQSISLLIAPYFIGRRLRIIPILLIYFLASAGFLTFIFYGLFPVTFIEGSGLTLFKIINEYIISLILAVAIISLRKKRKYFEKPVLDMLIWSMLATIASEMAFTLYTDVYGFFNTLGHYFKIVSFYLFYMAIIKTNLKTPYEAMAHEIAERKKAEVSVRQSNARLRRFVDSNIVGVVIASPSGDVIEANDYYLRLIGYSREEFEQGKVDWRAITPPEWLPADEHAIEELRKQGICTPYEKEYVRRDGKRVSVFLSDAMLPGPEEEIAAFALDITERKRAEEALLESNERLKKVLEVENVGVMFWDLTSGCMTDANDAFLNLMGYSRSEVEARELTWQKLTPPEYVDLSLAEIRKFQETGRIGPYEKEYFRKDGTRQWMLFAGSSLGGNTCVEFCVDITERKKAEAALRKSEERLRSVIDGLGQEMFVGLLTPDGRVLEANQPALSAAGLKLEDVIGKPVEETYWFSYSESVKKQLRNAVELAAGGNPSRFDVEIRIGENQFIILDFSMQPLRNDTGRIVFLIPSALVVTERRKAEEELRITNEELLAINRIITTTTTTTTTGVKELLEKVMDEALNITGLEGGTICMVTPDETLHLAVHRETSEATIFDLTTNEIKIGDCLCGECAKDHKPLILRDREEVLEFATREATRGEDIRFHAAYPLVIGERCLGVLCVFTRTDFKPIERRLKLLETVTAQIAIAVDNAQMFETISHHAAILEDKVQERTGALQESQKALENIVEDLNRKTEELRVANERLKEVDRLKSMFIASMSHELRTPLNSIIGFSSILLDEWLGTLNEEQKMNLSSILKSGRHLLALISDVIDVSKIEAGMIDVHEEDFELDDVIKEAVNLFTKETQDKGLV